MPIAHRKYAEEIETFRTRLPQGRAKITLSSYLPRSYLTPVDGSAREHTGRTCEFCFPVFGLERPREPYCLRQCTKLDTDVQDRDGGVVVMAALFGLYLAGHVGSA